MELGQTLVKFLNPAKSWPVGNSSSFSLGNPKSSWEPFSPLFLPLQTKRYQSQEFPTEPRSHTPYVLMQTVLFLGMSS